MEEPDNDYEAYQRMTQTAQEDERPLESDVQFNAEITRVHTKSDMNNLINAEDYLPFFTEDLTKGNLNTEQRYLIEHIGEIWANTISYACRFKRDMSYNANLLVMLVHTIAVPSRGQDFTAVKVAKTQFSEISRKSDDILRQEQLNKKRKGIKGLLFGR